MLTRATLETSNDDPKMQEVDVNLSHSEKARGVEHVQPYGFSSRPVGPTSEGGTKRRAEAVIAHSEGSRSHPVVIMVSDRRYRPKGMKAGEVQIHDNQSQSIHLTADGIVLSSPKKVTFNCGSGSITMTPDGTITLKGSAIKMEQA